MIIIDGDTNNKLEIYRFIQRDGSYLYLSNVKGAAYEKFLDRIPLDLYPIIYNEATANGIANIESFINNLIENKLA